MPKKTEGVLGTASAIGPHHPNIKSHRAKWMRASRILVKQKITTGVTKFVRCIRKRRRHLFLALCNVSVSNAAGEAHGESLAR